VRLERETVALIRPLFVLSSLGEARAYRRTSFDTPPSVATQDERIGSIAALALATLLLALLSAPALAEEGVFTGALGGGVAATFSNPYEVQGLVSFSGRYGLSNRLNLELPLDLALGSGPADLLVGLGLAGVWWQDNHWRFSSGGGLVADYSLATHVPWSWGPYAQTSLRWLAFWGVGFSLDVRAYLPVAVGELTPLQLSGPSIWRVVLLPTLSVYQEL
jgi:hypothetical protein